MTTVNSEHKSTQKQFKHPLLNGQLQENTNQVESEISPSSIPYLQDHQVFKQIVFPATAYLEMALALGTSCLDSGDWVVENFIIQQAFLLSDNTSSPLVMNLLSNQKERASIEFCSEGDRSNSPTSQITHASVTLVATPASKAPHTQYLEQQHRLAKLSVETYYDQCQKRCIHYGPRFQVIDQLWRQDGEALGQILLTDDLASELPQYRLHPVPLDVCFQVLWAALPTSSADETYLPVSIESTRIYGTLSQNLWSYAKIRSDQVTTDHFIADAALIDETGALLIEMQGIRVQRVSESAKLQYFKRDLSIAIAASFTADLIEDSLAFWMNYLNLPYQVKIAPYNQVFQELLNPNSLLSRNKEGVNVVLIRFEDLEHGGHKTQQPNLTQISQQLEGRSSYLLPNQLKIAQLNPYETQYLYQEIFEDQVYLKHGITLQPGDCIVDVGANIGMFSLFVQQNFPDSEVYAFEPAPHVFEALQINTELYCPNAHIFNCGLAAEDTEQIFTFYPRSSVFSSFAADAHQDEQAIRSVVVNMVQSVSNLSGESLDHWVDELMRDRLQQETFLAQLRSLSSVIEEHQIEKIDLLKLDAEKSELAVLQGIKESDWHKIKQIVVEVHDQSGSSFSTIKQLLEQQGFELIIEEEILLQGSGLYNIYATRPLSTQASSLETSSLGAFQVLSTTLTQTVEELAIALKLAARESKTPQLVYICPPSPEMKANRERQTLYEQMTALLAVELEDINSSWLINYTDLADVYNVQDVHDPYSNEFGHIPYTSTYFAALGTSIARKLFAIKNSPYKVIVLDCDNTLWQGVCGEDGVEGIVLSTPYQALQSFVIKKYEEGMLICLCSKNKEADVWAVFDQRSDMRLKREQIVSWRINWNAKSSNIISLAKELNLGLDSFIFIDDNPVECAEVESHCPEVLTLHLPTDIEAIDPFLEHTWAFDQLHVTGESRQRTQLYQLNIQREKSRQQAPTLADFLKSLSLKVTISPWSMHQIDRISQLTYRTNQFNLTTRRRTEGEISNFLQHDDFECLIVEASDRFGDYGLVGVLIFNVDSIHLNVDTFLLSCRALGKGIEHKMLAKLGEIATQRDLEFVNALYRPTLKNEPAFEFLKSVGQDYQFPKEDEWIFQLPVAVARQCTYQPQERIPADPEKVATTDDNEQDSDLRLANTDHRRDKRALFKAIESELHTPEQILSTLQSQKLRRQSSMEKETYLAPTNELELKLCKILEKVLDTSPVGLTDNFFDLGGTSLSAVRLFAEIDQELGEKLNLSILSQAPTIQALSPILSHASEVTTWSSLVPIQANGTKPPLYAIHSLGEGFSYFRSLGRYLGPEQPIYGLRYGLVTYSEEGQQISEGKLGTKCSLEELAAYYIDEIRQFQPEGPYCLVGASMGGLIAYEMAQQLLRQEQSVPLLALLDTYAPGGVIHISKFNQALRAGIKAIKLGPSVFSFAYKRIRKSRQEKLSDQHRRSQNLHRLKIVNAWDYVPSAYPGRISLFKAVDKTSPFANIRFDQKPALGWDDVDLGELDVQIVPGSHLSIFSEPNVAILAKQLSQCIKRAS